jgi:hypothetical protein
MFIGKKIFYEGHNNIGLEGCRILSLSDWPKLERLDVSIIFSTKIIILLQMKEFDI